MLFNKHIVEFGILLNVVRVWAIKIFRERHRQDFNIHLSLFKKLFHKWLNCVFSSFFTLLFSIHSISLSVWDRFIIYQFNKRSIYDYFKFFVFGRSDSWRSDWGYPRAGHYCLHSSFCVCQNLQTAEPWSNHGVPSTVRGQYQFKYVTVFVKY